MGSPSTLDSGNRSHSRTDDHIRARPGIALVLAGGLELALGLWPARWWAASAPTGLHHHAMSHALPAGTAITLTEGSPSMHALLIAAIARRAGRRRPGSQTHRLQQPHREVGNRTSRFALRTGHFSPSREVAS
jgi:hypothetical protein